MKLINNNLSARFGGRGLKYLGFPVFLLCLGMGEMGAANAAGVKKEAVLESMSENQGEWKARTAGPRPHLYFNGRQLSEIRERLRSDNETCAILSEAAAKIVAKPLPPFLTPEEEMKERGTPKLTAYAQNWQRQVGNNLVTLCIAGLVDTSPALRETIRQRVIGICHYPTWGFLSNVPNCDLSCAHLAVGVALAWDWYNDLWMPEERELILKTIRDRANGLLGGGYGSAYWYQTFDHNHNHVSAAGLGICGAAFFNEIPEAPEWLAFARLNFQKVARDAASDGSSPEGVSYWSYGLFFILQYIEATRGVIDSADLYQAPFLKNAAAYRLHVSTPGFEGILPWGDAAALDFSGPRQNLYRLADEYRDEAAWWLAEQIPTKLHAFNLLWGATRPESKNNGPQTLDHYFHDGQTLTTRTGWGRGDYLLSLKAGLANRPHSHLDIGALALSFGNEWLLTAPGYGIDPTRPGFWDRKGRRWQSYSPATESHSTLLVDGENQRFDMNSKGTISAFFSTPLWTWGEADLTGAYHKVSAMSRGILHRRGEYILVSDSVEAPEAVSVEWLAQLAREPRRDGNALEVVGERGTLRLEMLRPAKPFEPRTPTVPFVDVLKQEINTHAVRETGRSISMLALLTPRFPGAPVADLKSAIRPLEGGGEEIVIEGSGWTDRIIRGSGSAPVEIAAGEGSGLQLKARTAAIRTRGNEVESFIATGVEKVSLSGMALATGTPCNLGMQRTPEGKWILDCSQKIDQAITLPSGRSLVAVDFHSGNSMEGEGGFRYEIAEAGADLSQVAAWLASLIGMRNEPELEIRAPAPQPPLPASEQVAIEAEDYAYQSKGKVTIKQQAHASGKTVVTSASGNGNHLAWCFEVQTAGQYQLRLRHGDSNPDLRQPTPVTVVLDGVVPGEAMKEAVLPEMERGQRWRESVLSDSAGNPLVFHLSSGRHELYLRFARGINLDVLTFIGAGAKP